MKCPSAGRSKTACRITKLVKMVSVVIPLYNAETTVAAALDSVRVQTYRGMVETIVVDDGSTDASAEKVLKYQQLYPEFPLILLCQQNKGVSEARNAGISKASGDYIALLDADDVWFPDKLENQIRYLSQHPEIDFVAAMRRGQKILPPYKAVDGVAKVTFRKLLLRNEVITPAVVFRKKIISACGLFDAEQRHAEDLNYWLRISLHCKMVILNEILLETGGGKRSFGVSGLSANLPEMERGFHKNLRELYENKSLSMPEYFFYKWFYHAKYAARVVRNRYFKMLNR